MKLKWVSIVGLAVLAFAGTANATPINLITNGGFETGDFTGWTVQNLGSGGCGSNVWSANSLGTHSCNNNGIGNLVVPTDGTFAAYNTNDGPAGQLVLSQQLTFGAGAMSGSISWLDQQANHTERVFSIDLYDAANTVLLGNLYTHSSAISMGAWESHLVSVDSSLIQSLAGSTVTLRLINNIPSSFTGPSGFGLDSVAFNVVPEPGTLALLVLGITGIGFTRRKKA